MKHTEVTELDTSRWSPEQWARFHAGLDPLSEKHPMQPVIIDRGGLFRFQTNEIVCALLDHSHAHGFGLNEIAVRFCDAKFDKDREQLAQLIGYSVSGYADLSYVSDTSYERASYLAAKLEV